MLADMKSLPVEQALSDFMPGQIMIASRITGDGFLISVIGQFVGVTRGGYSNNKYASTFLQFEDGAIQRKYDIVKGTTDFKPYDSDTLWSQDVIDRLRFFHMKAVKV